MMITDELKRTVRSSDIKDLFINLELKSGYVNSCKTLQELYDTHTQFISYINEWQQLYKFLKSENETDYINYMNQLKKDNPFIFNNLEVSGISFDSECKTIDSFISKQKSETTIFPFAEHEIVAWDQENFILKDTIYYEITGNHMVFFLSRLNNPPMAEMAIGF
jgi:hypothetical protein